ncbi:MAG TPA: 3-hydroxyacyl-CoA dehydrogenase NAD-binding domain-containing protein [Alphaproteobacteria bacterium]|jgi:3-hydroxyacyl-CoA dehydrogenase|nr:3-hydroxyacyl-CoA dehydrogenase NAD-binding domain-containing protein [Alphaproteobacteria bacterium]
MTEAAKADALEHVKQAEAAVWTIPDVPADTALRPIAKATIVGAGTMGGGIAMSFANAGIPVKLVDLDQASLERGLGRIRGNYANTVSKGKLTQEAMDQRMALLTPTTDIAAVADADIVIEAVFERMDIKRDIFRKLDRLCRPGAILATNTSMLDINTIAAETGRPQDVVGTHFFSPANVMRLLEIVRGDKTAKDVLATTLSVAKRIGKIPVVVGVCDGFVGNRMIEPYFREAEFLVAEGASPAEVDKALTDFGLAMGPFAMSDMAGIDVSWDVRKRRAALRVPGERYSALVDRLGEAGRFGQKTNAGYYRYEPGSRVPVPDTSLDAVFAAEAERQGVKRRVVSAEEIVDRCMYALVNEGADILADGIAARSSDIDVIYVAGYGFPAALGGPMYWADRVGLQKVNADIQKLAQDFGGHWKPSPLLARLAAEGRSFADFRRE